MEKKKKGVGWGREQLSVSTQCMSVQMYFILDLSVYAYDPCRHNTVRAAENRLVFEDGWRLKGVRACFIVESKKVHLSRL